MDPEPVSVPQVRPRRGRPPQAGLAERRRLQIVESACQVFAERGYERANISDIAQHAGVGQGTIYRYFETKRELLDHVVDHGFELLLDATGLDAADAAPGSADDLAQRLRTMAERLFALADEQPALLRLVILDAIAVDAEMKARLFGLYGTLSAMTASYLEHGQRSGWVRPEADPMAVARAAIALVTPGLLLVLRGEAAGSSRSRYVDGLIDFVLHGIGRRAR